MTGWLDRGGPTRGRITRPLTGERAHRSGRGTVGWPTTPLYRASTRNAALVADVLGRWVQVRACSSWHPLYLPETGKVSREFGDVAPTGTSRHQQGDVSHGKLDFLQIDMQSTRRGYDTPLLIPLCKTRTMCARKQPRIPKNVNVRACDLVRNEEPCGRTNASANLLPMPGLSDLPVIWAIRHAFVPKSRSLTHRVRWGGLSATISSRP